MKYADIVLKSSAIFDSVSDLPFAGGVAIEKNKILAVERGEHINSWIGPETKVMNFEDKLIMPGFIDAHDHCINGMIHESDHVCTAISMSTSEEDCVRIIKEYADSHPEEKQIRGHGWFPAAWGDAELPTLKSLDKVIPDRPVYLVCADGHSIWLNSKAVEEVGVSADWKLSSGSVGVFENGEPNGLLFEPEAMAPAMEKMGDFSDEEFSELIKEGLGRIAAKGITGMSDMSALDAEQEVRRYLELYKNLDDSGALTCRIYLYSALNGVDNYESALSCQRQYNTERYKLNGVKGFVDGVTSTFTGYLLEPYTDRPDTTGDGCPLVPYDKMEKDIIAANAAGLQVRLHCVGDGAVRMALDIYECSKNVNGDHGLQNTIEHIEIIHPDDISRFAELEVIPSMQPEHLVLDANEKESRCGMERSKYAWAHKSILKAGGKLAFGTDFPVIGYDPLTTINAAVTRLGADGHAVCINPWECLELADVLKACTAGAANSYNMLDKTGTLETGKLADIVVLEKNLFKLPVHEIKNASVEMTMFDGRIVYKKGDN